MGECVQFKPHVRHTFAARTPRAQPSVGQPQAPNSPKPDARNSLFGRASAPIRRGFGVVTFAARSAFVRRSHAGGSRCGDLALHCLEHRDRRRQDVWHFSGQGNLFDLDGHEQSAMANGLHYPEEFGGWVAESEVFFQPLSSFACHRICTIDLWVPF